MSRPPVLDTVLLDAGGVLLDLDYAGLCATLAGHGCRTDEAALARAEARARTEIDRRVRSGGRTSEAWRDYFRMILADAGAAPQDVEEIVDGLWDAHARHGLWTVPIAGTIEPLRRLRARGYRLGVVSNAEGRVERDLLAAGYAGLFDTVVDSFRVGVEKPDPAIFHIALERLGSRPERAMHVGDVPSVDVAGARAAGILPVLLDRHDLYPEVDAPRVGSIAELERWLPDVAGR